MPIRQIHGKLPANRPVHKPLTLAVLAYLAFSLLVTLTILLMSFTVQGNHASFGLPLIPICIAGIAVVIYIFRRRDKLPPLVPHRFEFNPKLRNDPWKVVINVEWPPQFDAKWPEGTSHPYAHLINTNPTSDRFRADLEIRLNKMFEYVTQTPQLVRYTGTAPYVFTSTTVEESIAQVINFLQDQLQIPLVKYDCVSVHPLSQSVPPPSPPPAPKQDPDDAPLPVGEPYPFFDPPKR